MSNPLDTDAGSELFSSYEAELKLVQADLNQKLDQIPELSGEPRNAAISQAERALEEANELLDQMRLEKSNIPSAARTKINQRFRNHETDTDSAKRRLANLSNDRAALFVAGTCSRISDGTPLSGTERLDRSTQRLRDSQRLANETEDIGASTLADLHRQRNVIDHTHETLLQSEGYVDRSVKTLKGMARRMATNKIITIAIITVLVLLILAVISRLYTCFNDEIELTDVVVVPGAEVKEAVKAGEGGIAVSKVKADVDMKAPERIRDYQLKKAKEAPKCDGRTGVAVDALHWGAWQHSCFDGS
ncbi:vesicle transport through interaction with t-SNAREs 1, partial [Pseudogymnoascus sp. 24MN13]